jgi:predicted transcriptional regulator
VKTLKRHLQSAHGLDPHAYRERWGLKRDYPMTAPSYSERRSAMARQLGLGRKPGESPKRRGRKKPAAEAA